MASVRLLVSVVDDDVSVRESVPALLQSFGLDSAAFASAEDFLNSSVFERTDCLLLDVAMEGMSGPDLQREVLRRKCGIPIVVITANTDQNVRTRLMKQGAIDCLFKPFGDEALEMAVSQALAGQ